MSKLLYLLGDKMQHARDDVFVLDMFRFEDLEMNNSLLNRSQEERFAINVQVCGEKLNLAWYKCMIIQNTCFLVRIIV